MFWFEMKLFKCSSLTHTHTLNIFFFFGKEQLLQWRKKHKREGITRHIVYFYLQFQSTSESSKSEDSSKKNDDGWWSFPFGATMIWEAEKSEKDKQYKYPAPTRNESHCYSFTFWGTTTCKRGCHNFILILVFQRNQFLQSFQFSPSKKYTC